MYLGRVKVTLLMRSWSHREVPLGLHEIAPYHANIVLNKTAVMRHPAMLFAQKVMKVMFTLLCHLKKCRWTS